MPNLYLELIDMLEEQKTLLTIKDELICKLLNENAEKENLINELLRGSDPSLFIRRNG